MWRALSVLDAFEKDVTSDSLPQVSFIVAPTALSEHAQNHPQDGEAFSAEVIRIFFSNPVV